MSEKNTDRYMQNVYEEVFNHEYHTEANNELFDSLIPDGWDIIDNLLIIICMIIKSSCSVTIKLLISMGFNI